MSQPFRVPVAGSINNRISASAILGPATGFVGIGVVGIMVVGKASDASSKDQRFINCFSETVIDAATGQTSVYMVKRPGFAVSHTTATVDKGTAVLAWTGYSTGDSIIAAFGSTNSTLYNGTASLGAITGKATGISETFVSTTPTLTISSSDNTGWYYDVPTVTCTKIADADFPGNAGKTLAGTFAHMDGYAVIMCTDGTVYASDLNSVTSWTATSYGSANSYPDTGVGVVRHRNFLMAFGTESIEFFQNAGLTPFPFSKIPSMTQRVGAVSADAIAQIADTTFWCGSSSQGGLSVFQYDAGIGRISTPEIDQILILAGASNISLTALRFYGRSFVIVKASTVALAYCIEEKMWHEWSSSTMPWYKCVGVSKGGTMTNYGISNTVATGSVYVMNPNSFTFTDAGASYSALMQLDSMDLGTSNRKFWEEVRIICDKHSSSSYLTLSYSDDDYQTWTTWGTLDLAQNMPRAQRLGSSRRRAWALTHSDNSSMRIRMLEGRVTIGTS